MSTYITALVAGEYHEVPHTYDGKHGDIPLGHYCRQSLVEHLDVDELVKLTEQGFEFFEDAFDYPYPFGKYDQLYVPEYNMGAMENAGCVTLRDEYLPRSRQDRSFYEFRAEVILHEMAHMWFGDLVTMKWWDDLWLNESFAEWACYHAAVEATEFTEAWTGFTNARKNWAYRQDQLPSTHPIAADNVDLRAVEVNFDGITYAKGASVLKQLVAWVGLDNFLAGLRGYFKDFAFSQLRVRRPARRAGEVLGPRARLVGQGVAADLRRQHPRARVRARRRRQLHVVRRAPDRDPELPDAAPPPDRHRPLRRRRRPPRPPYVARDRRRGRAHRVADLVGEKQPDLLLLNDGDLAYAKIRLDERSLATVVDGIGTLDDSLARALCWGAAWDMTRDAEMSATDFVRARAARHRRRETDASGVSRIPSYAAQAANSYSAPAHRDGPARDLGAGPARRCSTTRSRAATTS